MQMKYFGKISRLTRIILALDLDSTVYKITSKQKAKRLIIELNTNEQLFKGIDSTGRTLESIGGGYAPLTIEIKKSKGQPYDRVTLKDTGEFYESFDVRPFKGGFRIEADAIKEDDDLTMEWGEDIIGLTEESKERLVIHYRNAIIQELKKKIRGA